MKKLFLYIPLICIVFFIVNCKDINSIHDMYLENGETIYIARVDSVDAFSGNERVLLRLYTKNPIIKTFAIFWDQKNDSLIVPVENRVSPDYFDVQIGKNSKILTEKSYVFEIFSRDNRGHRSIKFEKIADVYGERYGSSLQNHFYKSAAYNSVTSTLTVTWFPSIDLSEIAVGFKYQDKLTGLTVSKIVGVKNLGTTTLLTNVAFSSSTMYQTLFKPTPTAIDTFYTDFQAVALK